MSHDHDGDQTFLHGAKPPVMTALPTVEWRDANGTTQRADVSRALVVGSSTHCAIQLADRSVSRVHVELAPRDDGLWVRDLGSRNGTYVNEVRVTGALVPDGGIIRLGATELAVQYETGARSIDVWPHPYFHGLVGGSEKMRKLYATLERVAKANVPVLIRGETGTGKELVAQAIHDASPRAGGPFVVVDCGAIPETLLDSEFFGHTKGAFTGAVDERKGAFEAAGGGTVFLDEIGEVPLSMQPKLLRVLESRAIRRVGEVHYRSVDVRFVCATHRDLLKMVSQGTFREDLYFRLSVVPLEVPSLRERPEDLGTLVTHFVKRSGGRALDLETLTLLKEHSWPGNVRELRNFLDRTQALGTANALTALGIRRDDSPPSSISMRVLPHSLDETPSRPLVGAASTDIPFKDFRDRWMEQGERAYLERILADHGRNVDLAAKAAGLDRSYLYRLMRKYGL